MTAGDALADRIEHTVWNFTCSSIIVHLSVLFLTFEFFKCRRVSAASKRSTEIPHVVDE